MRKIILAVLCMLFVMPLFGQKRGYIAFKVSGDVCVLKNGEWHGVFRRDTLSLKDILRIRPESRLGILDISSSQVFYADKPGEQKLAMMISDAKRQADKVTGLVNQQIRESLKKDQSGSETYAVTGAAFRGESSASQAQLVYASLYGLETHEADGSVSMKKVYVDEEEFYFQIRNNRETPLIVNVLKVCLPDGKKSLCFNVGYSIDEPYVMVAPKSELSLEHYIFYNSKDYRYFLFATSNPYDSQELEMLLKHNQEPAEKCADSVIYFGGSL